jgi:hypothetical protein
MGANPLDAIPAEMVTAVAGDAARDADRVGLFLSYLGLKGTPERPLPMPGAFLLYLGAALRLLHWEGLGFFFHREAGLPEASQAIRKAFLSLNDPGADPAELCAAVMRLSIERFAWGGPPELGAEVALEDAQEDALLNALADYLWAHRPR